MMIKSVNKEQNLDFKTSTMDVKIRKSKYLPLGKRFSQNSEIKESRINCQKYIYIYIFLTHLARTGTREVT